MTEYQFHCLPTATEQRQKPSVSLQAQSNLHGAALALRQFVQLGFDVTTPLAHLDMSEPDGARYTSLVQEVLDWLADPKQAAFIQREGLGALLQ